MPTIPSYPDTGKRPLQPKKTMAERALRAVKRVDMDAVIDSANAFPGGRATVGIAKLARTGLTRALPALQRAAAPMMSRGIADDAFNAASRAAAPAVAKRQARQELGGYITGKPIAERNLAAANAAMRAPIPAGSSGKTVLRRQTKINNAAETLHAFGPRPVMSSAVARQYKPVVHTPGSVAGSLAIGALTSPGAGRFAARVNDHFQERKPRAK